MNQAMRNVAKVLCDKLRQHAKGGVETDAAVMASMELSGPGTIAAVCDACKSGSWATPEIPSRAADLEKKRAASRAKADK